jgi:4-amino-4-deoxy-L-arabinose transferase-like glycosyltransferase
MRELSRSWNPLADPPSKRGVWVSLVVCALFAATLSLYELNVRPLYAASEVRYALIGLEMHESGDWIQPRLNQARYYEKPPLLYWSVAASYGLFGVNEFAARLPSALAYIGTAVTVFLIALSLGGPRVAPLASLVYATSFGPFLFGRFLFTDTLLVFCLSLSLLGLVRMVLSPDRWAGVVLFYLGISLAGLTKGIVGIVIPMGSLCLWCAVNRVPLFDGRFKLLPGIAIVAATYLPWHVALAWRDPSFVRYFIVNEHICRFLNCREPTDFVAQGVAGFWVSSLIWFLPWTFFLPGALRRALPGIKTPQGIPLIWALWVVGFFSLAGARLEYYALPAFPALAVVVGVYWEKLFASEKKRWGIEIPSLLLILAGLVILPFVFLSRDAGTALLTSVVSNLDGVYREYFAAHPEASFPFVSGALRTARTFAVVLLLLGGSTWFAARTLRFRAAFLLWVVLFVPVLGLVDEGQRLIAMDRSQKHLADIVIENWEANAYLVVSDHYYEDHAGVTYYTDFPTHMVNGTGGDLFFGHKKGDAGDLFLSEGEFDRLWNSPSRLFVVGDGTLRISGATVAARSPHQVLLTNRPFSSEAGRISRLDFRGARE